MNFEIHEHDNITIIRVFGGINISNKDKLKDAIFKIINSGKKKIILDIDQIKNLSSIALGLLTYSQKEIQSKNNGEIKLVSLSTTHKDIFEVTKLNEIFEVCDSIDIAVKKYKVRMQK